MSFIHAKVEVNKLDNAFQVLMTIFHQEGMLREEVESHGYIIRSSAHPQLCDKTMYLAGTNGIANNQAGYKFLRRENAILYANALVTGLNKINLMHTIGDLDWAHFPIGGHNCYNPHILEEKGLVK